MRRRLSNRQRQQLQEIFGWGASKPVPDHHKAEYAADEEKLWHHANWHEGKRMKSRGRGLGRGAVLALGMKHTHHQSEMKKIKGKWQERGHSIKARKPDSAKGWLEKHTNGYIKW